MPPLHRRLLTLLTTICLLLFAAGACPPALADDTFRTDIAPLLADACGSCHGPNAAESGFRIDLREQAFTIMNRFAPLPTPPPR